MKPIDIGPADLETVRRVLREHVPRTGGLGLWIPRVLDCQRDFRSRYRSHDNRTVGCHALSGDARSFCPVRPALSRGHCRLVTHVGRFFQKMIEQDHVVLAKVKIIQ